MKTKRFLCLLAVLCFLLPSCATLQLATPETSAPKTREKVPLEPKTEASHEEEDEEADIPLATVVGRLREPPSYALPDGASTGQIRAMAIQAQRDELSVKWTPSKSFTYQKESGAASDKDFICNKGQVFAGLPYTNAGTGLFHWLEYYDYETGVINAKSFFSINSRLGNSCAASVAWGWASVCASVSCTSTETFVYANGCIPVAPCSYDPSIRSFSSLSTVKIRDDNGQTAMFAAYANVKPADALVSSGANSAVHAMMSTYAAHVEYTNGRIDGEKSYIMIQDQRASYEAKIEDGQSVYYEGRTSAKMTFQSLYNNSYLPITNAEFLGTAPYRKPTVTYVNAVKAGPVGEDGVAADVVIAEGTREAVGKGRVQCPFRIVSVSARITDRDGKEVLSKKNMVGRSEIENGTAKDYDLSTLALTSILNRSLSAGQSYHYEVKVLVATGETLTPVAFDFIA